MLEMVINRVEWRRRPPHQRSAAKKKQRAQKHVAVRRWRAAASAATTATATEAGAKAPAGDQVQLRERDLERQLKIQRQLLKSERKRRCRDVRVLLADVLVLETWPSPREIGCTVSGVMPATRAVCCACC